jgi:hypothetical protein
MAVTWSIKTLPATTPENLIIYSFFISDDGQEIILGGKNRAGLIRRMDSADGGTTWNVHTPADGVFYYLRSADGTVEVEHATGSSSVVRVTRNGVQNQTLLPLPATDMLGTLSDDGSVIMLVNNLSGFISTNYGESFSQPAFFDGRRITFIGISADGSVLMTFEYNGNISISYDYGVTWIQRRVPGVSNLSTGVLARDGNTIVVTTPDRDTYTSDDRGITWTTAGGVLPYTPRRTATSADAQHMLSVSWDGTWDYTLRYTADGGATWLSPPMTITTPWRVGMSLNGRWGIASDPRAQPIQMHIVDFGTLYPIQTWTEIFIGATPVQELRLGEKLVWQRPA